MAPSIDSVPRHPWHLWPGDRAWPASSTEERRFVSDLSASTAVPTDEWDRSDLTMLVTALRCGVSVDAVIAWAPGARPGRLRAAYEAAHSRLVEASEAWRDVVSGGDYDALTRSGPAAARILPAAVGALVQAAVATSGAALPLAVAKADRRVRTAGDEVAAVERDLAGCTDPVRAVWLGRRLFDPYRTGMWHGPMFLPSRVGQLTPERLESLLVEVDDGSDDRFDAWSSVFTED